MSSHDFSQQVVDNNNAWLLSRAEELPLSVSGMLRTKIRTLTASSKNYKSIWISAARMIGQTSFFVDTNYSVRLGCCHHSIDGDRESPASAAFEAHGHGHVTGHLAVSLTRRSACPDDTDGYEVLEEVHKERVQELCGDGETLLCDICHDFPQGKHAGA